MHTILRNGQCYLAEPQEIIETDFVLTTNGHFVPAIELFKLRSQFGIIEESNTWGDWQTLLSIVALALFSHVIIDAFSAPSTNRRRKLHYSDEPLPAWKRDYVRERDGEVCVYCGSLARDGHADHRKSRFNGGTNHLTNLSWACRQCNLRKGALNARQFIPALNAS